MFVVCIMILANGCRKEWQIFREVLESEKDLKAFKQALRKVYNSAPKGAQTRVSIRQRHFKARTVGVNDAKIDLNIAMLLGLGKSKYNAIWWDALKEVAQTKNKYNYQLDIGYELSYEKIQDLKNHKATGILVDCFDKLKPVYEFITNG